METMDLFADLTADELAALSGKFRSARKACRKVMHVNWHNAPVTEAYRRMLVDLRANDPLFTSDIGHDEIGR